MRHLYLIVSSATQSKQSKTHGAQGADPLQSRAQSVSGPRTGSAPIARTSCYSLTTSVLVLSRAAVIFSRSVQ
jgi:hypothetical protein